MSIEIEDSLRWWEIFVGSLATEMQHYDDYLNDLCSRKKLAQQITEMPDHFDREAAIRRLKAADEVFIRHTLPFNDGLLMRSSANNPDLEWFFYRIPLVIGKDFPNSA